MLKSYILLVLTVSGITAWNLLTIRAGQDWGDDFSLYIHHAKNIAEGRPYADTGYIYNPSLPSLSPRTYPPVFPLLLAPIYRCFGFNLTAMKVLVVLLLAAFLMVTYQAARRELPPMWALVLLLLIGLNPYVWEQKDRLLSEIPFLLALALSLWVLDVMNTTTGRRRFLLALLGGLCMYLAYGTRTAGAVLPIAVVLCDLLRFRRVALSTIVALAVFTAGVLMQKMLFVADGSYFDQLVFDPRLFASNLVSLAKAMGLFVDNGFSGAARTVLFLLLTTLAMIGYVRCLRRRLTARELFGPLYFALIVIWPAAGWDQRFLLPLLPLFFLYMLHGVEMLRENARLMAIPAAVLPLLVITSYVAHYTRLEFGPHSEGVTKAESVEFFEYVKMSARRDDVIIFQKPRALALLAQCRAAAHHRPRSDEEFWKYLDDVGATHLVICRVFQESAAVLRPFVERHGDRLREAFRNADFVVYRIEPMATAHAPKHQ
jgi:hypothetical protein